MSSASLWWILPGSSSTRCSLSEASRARPPTTFERVDGFLRELSSSRASAAGVDALRAAVDDWLARMVGPLLGRVGTLLAAPDGQDMQRVREVLRAIGVLLDGVAGDARASLAEVGGLVTASLDQHDLAGARLALAAARTWLDEHQWEVAARLRRPFGDR